MLADEMALGLGAGGSPEQAVIAKHPNSTLPNNFRIFVSHPFGLRDIASAQAAHALPLEIHIIYFLHNPKSALTGWVASHGTPPICSSPSTLRATSSFVRA